MNPVLKVQNACQRMKRHRTAAIVVFIQALVLPILFGSLSGPDRASVLVLQAMLALLCVAVFVGKKWAIWTAFALMVIQIPVIEVEHIAWRCTAGSSLSVGVLTGESWLDARLSLNFFNGYFFNGAIFHAPQNRQLTNGREVTGAFMLNLAVMPATILLLGRRTPKASNRDRV